MQRRAALVRLGALGVLGTCDLLSLLTKASAQPVTATVRLRLPSGFDSTVTVLTDTVTVFERSAATCAAPGQTTIAHQLGATALTAFHRALEQYQLPPNPCGAPYELRYFPSFGSLYLGAVHCYRERCQVHGWVYAVNGQEPGIGMDQQPIADGDELFVDFLPITTALPEEIEARRLLTVTVGPNPFDELVEIQLSLPKAAEITISIYNTSGQCVRLLRDHREFSRGAHRVRWDGTDDQAIPVPAGVYFIRIVHHRSGSTRILKVSAR
ncbi:MAG: T9SS type A sorting domain-containing protein [Candidatus Kerfeldbacteria bacterium]|nr:T9SS type A sorting domain-containing protein [Candidatus Kerfeldbacteria bacterium]